MSRLTPLNEAEMNAEQRQVYDAIMAGPRGHVVGPLAVWLRNPGLANPAQQLGAYCRYGSSLSPRLSELAIITVGAHWKAAFEWYSHAPIALKAGVSEEIVAAIKEDQEPDFVNNDEQLIYSFTRELITHRKVSEQTYKRAVDELGLTSVIDLVGIVGYYTFISMTLNVFEIPVPEGEENPFP